MDTLTCNKLEYFFEYILKDAEKVQSFVIEEVALAQLLEGAWRPVGKKLIKNLAGIIDFKKYTYNRQKAINFQLWLSEDMYDDTLNKIWNKIEKQVKKFIGKAYQRGIDEEGAEPDLTQKSEFVQKSRASVYAERKANAINNLSEMARQIFASYARDKAIPAINSTIDGLNRIDIAARRIEEDKQLLQDAKELEQAVLAGKLRIMALQKARKEMIDKLQSILATNKDAAGTAANMTVAKAHHFAFLDWAQENGIEYYRISAKLDNKTCVACLEMDGKVFKVSDAIAYKDKYLKIAGDKEKLKEESPFLTAKVAPNVKGVDLSKFINPIDNIDFSSYNDLTMSDYDFKHNRKEKEQEQYKYLNETFVTWKEAVDTKQLDALNTYKGPYYRNINAYLRNEDSNKNPSNKLLESIEYLDKTYQNASIENNTVVYRGSQEIIGEFLEKIGRSNWSEKIGTELQLDSTFMSTSIEKRVAIDFSGLAFDKSGVLYKIYIPKTSKAAICPDIFPVVNNEEREILINRNSKFRLIATNEEERIVEFILLD